MSNPITTGTFSTGNVSTDKGTMTTREWVEQHSKDIEGKTVSGNTLTTDWTSSNGAQQVVTYRLEGPPPEPDAQFIARHTAAFVTAMASENPIS